MHLKQAATALSCRRKKAESRSIPAISGSLFDPKALDAGPAAKREVIHLLGLIRPIADVKLRRIHVEGRQAVLAAARRDRVRQIIHLSARGARPDAVSEYHKRIFLSEESGWGSEFFQMESDRDSAADR